MIFIDNVLISEEIIEQKFVCNLNACKGACCWKGDYGAPLSTEEINDLRVYNDVIANQLNEKSKDFLSNKEGAVYYEEAEQWGTACHEDGACVYLNFEENGLGTCVIEKSHKDGLIPFNKPMSCHLYPIRVTSNPLQGFEAWNYDEWDICNAACALGEELKVPIYKFLKEPIIRYKGAAFYQGLEEAASSATT